MTDDFIPFNIIDLLYNKFSEEHINPNDEKGEVVFLVTLLASLKKELATRDADFIIITEEMKQLNAKLENSRKELSYSEKQKYILQKQCNILEDIIKHKQSALEKVEGNGSKSMPIL